MSPRYHGDVVGNTMDIDAYCRRIGYDGPRHKTLSTLNDIIASHTASIPFENIDVLCGAGISLDDDAVFRKLVLRKRGGYCFEQNALLLRALQHIGFVATPLSGRVRVDRDRAMTPPRTHMFLRVDLDGRSFFADVGVGGLTPTSAVPVPRVDGSDAGTVVATPHEPRRFLFEDVVGGGPRRWFHQAQRGTEWRDVCEFTFEDMPPIDRELGNWFTSAHPQSHFKNRFVVARSGGPGVRYTILNRDFGTRREGVVDVVTIESETHLRDILHDVFRLDVDQATAKTCFMSEPSL
jgi:N-hydroxyarylamine O-acetyltransferase